MAEPTYDPAKTDVHPSSKDELAKGQASDPTQPRPGMEVTPRVRLVRPLDRGGMGSVWVAEHVTLGMKVRFTTVPVGEDAQGTEAIGFGFEPIDG